jgi:hypothetical protein
MVQDSTDRTIAEIRSGIPPVAIVVTFRISDWISSIAIKAFILFQGDKVTIDVGLVDIRILAPYGHVHLESVGFPVLDQREIRELHGRRLGLRVVVVLDGQGGAPERGLCLVHLGDPVAQRGGRAEMGSSWGFEYRGTVEYRVFSRLRRAGLALRKDTA